MPDVLYKTNNKIDPEKLEAIHWLTGFLPQELIILKSFVQDQQKLDGQCSDIDFAKVNLTEKQIHNVFHQFKTERSREFGKKLSLLLENADNKQQKLINEFLIQVLNPRYGTLTSVQRSVEGLVYDQGLFYRESRGGEYICINGIALTVLTRFYSNAMKSELKPIHNILVISGHCGQHI